MARFHVLSIAILASVAWVALRATSTLFVQPSGGNSAVFRATRVTMQAKKMALAEASMKKLTNPDYAGELSTGARNEVSIITPPVSSEALKDYLSLNVIFLGGVILMTFGGLIEIQRFFPDATYW